MIEAPYEAVNRFIRRFLVLPNESDYAVLVWWILHSYLIDRTFTTPRLAFLSPEYGCGKSRALEVIQILAFRAEKLDFCTRSYLFRTIEQVIEETGKPPTLLIDEVDNVFKNKNSEEGSALTAFLNTGYRRGGFYGITEGEGNNRAPKKFSTFAPIAFAGKGENALPEAVGTRSIVFRLQKRLPSQKIEDFYTEEVRQEAEELREWISQWADFNSEEFKIENVEIALRDRDREVWLPLYGVAKMSDSVEAFFEAVRTHQIAKATNETPLSRQLVEDCLRVFDSLNEQEKLKTPTLLNGLETLPESDYSQLRGGKGLNDRTLAKWLRGYGITPKQIRFGEESSKGYYRFEFQEALDRYSVSEATLPTHPVTETTETTETSVGLW